MSIKLSRRNWIEKDTDIEKAGEKMKDSRTVSMILAIARAKKVMDVEADWCEPWMTHRKGFTE